VPDRVLPAGSLLPLVVGKLLLDVIVDLTQLQFALAAVFDAHGYHGYVAERWFGVNIWKKKIKCCCLILSLDMMCIPGIRMSNFISKRILLYKYRSMQSG
jgi:hypothetical protein